MTKQGEAWDTQANEMPERVSTRRGFLARAGVAPQGLSSASAVTGAASPPGRAGSEEAADRVRDILGVDDRSGDFIDE
jgi:hypothetical protein